jgi:hypothetical protein
MQKEDNRESPYTESVSQLVSQFTDEDKIELFSIKGRN